MTKRHRRKTIISSPIASLEWESLYRSRWDSLPWVSSAVPLKPLAEFFGRLALPKKVLDFGCGNGRVAEVLDALGAVTVGADCSETAVQKSKPLKNGSYVVANSLDAFPSRVFNGVVLWGILHHYPPQTWCGWIHASNNLLRSGGVILLGGFDCNDHGFRGKPVRTSPTTGSNAYCVHEELIAAVVRDVGFSVVANDTIELEDGGDDGRRRTWRYIIGQV